MACPVEGCRVSSGVTQGNPMFPTIFNMVVDAVIHHWATVVSGEKTGPEGFGTASQKLAAPFYADGGILASPQPDRLKEALDVLTGLFERVRLSNFLTRRSEWYSNHYAPPSEKPRRHTLVG